jgi:hypothetical protein
MGEGKDTLQISETWKNKRNSLGRSNMAKNNHMLWGDGHLAL